MESSDTAPSAASSWTSATNWTVAGGSLENSLTFESSLSLIDDLDNDSCADRDQSTDGDTNLRSPLILYPPSPDSSSCEITLTFEQKHEVRQVYVRSTAKVFEIYCDPDLESNGEYLCTVRGCVAVRDEEVLRATNVEETVLMHQMGCNKELAGDKTKNGASPTNSEDDWVNVKAPRTSLSFEKNDSMSSNSDMDGGCSSQDLYEATAEICDTNPCKSLNIRLLSLQNKGCVCIHEVYVFAEPVDASTLENQAVPVENSSGSSLMTMLLPTLFQLSKTQGLGRERDKHHVDTLKQQISVEACSISTDEIGERNIREEELVPCDTHSLGEHKSVEVSSLTSGPINMKKEVPYEGKNLPLFEGRSEVPDAAHVPISASISEAEYKGSKSENCTESVLDHLVSRVNRIEDLFLRFEERILKPIISIDERLQRVEQHLEVITKKTCNHGTRISAPEFCCSESETNSFYNSGSLDPSYMGCGATKKDSTIVMSSFSPDVASHSENETLPQLSLLASSPEFDNVDEEEQNLAVESVQESPKFKQKKSVSIDDALASAFAGFLSSTSSQCHNYSPILAVRAPDFPNEDENENDDDQTSSASIQSEITTDPQDSDEIAGPKLLPGKTTESRDLTTLVMSVPCNKNASGLVDVEELLKVERAGAVADPHDSDEIAALPKFLSGKTTESRDLTTLVTSVPCNRNASGLVHVEELLKAERAGAVADPQDSDEIAALPKFLHGKTTESTDLTTSVTPVPCNKNVTGLVDVEELLKAEKAANGQNDEAYEGDENNVVHLAPKDDDLIGGTDSHLALEDVQKVEANDHSPSNAAILEQNEILKESSEDQADGNFNDLPQETALHQVSDSTSVTEQNSSHEELKKVIQLSRTSSAVDYDNPILEVKFTTEEIVDGGSPLQSLLSGFGDLDVEALSTQEESDYISGLDSQGDLIPVADWEVANSSAMDSCIFIDTNYCSLGDSNVNTEAIDKPDDPELCSNQEDTATSLI
ncbi:hypothetical protein LINPERPRIM_LOCUS39459 [Linum perenne]